MQTLSTSICFTSTPSQKLLTQFWNFLDCSTLAKCSANTFSCFRNGTYRPLISIDLNIISTQMESNPVEEILSKMIVKDHKQDQINHLVWQLQEHNYQPYLIQIVYLYTRKWWPQLETILLKQSASISNFEIIKWSFMAYTDKIRKSKPTDERVVLFDQKLEVAMVNANDYPSEISEENDLDHDRKYAEKEKRANYVNSIERFVGCLTQISLNLKSIPQTERKHYLRHHLIKANRALESFRHYNQQFKYCKGIILPFPDQSNQVVRVIDTEATAYNTKKRVPYRLVVETIDANDTEPELLLKKQVSLNTQMFLEYDALHQFDYTILEDFLAEKSKDKLVRKQLINQNTIRFNQQFPPRNLGERRNSCIQKIQQQTNKQLLDQQLNEYIKKNRKRSSHRDLELSQFLGRLEEQYPDKREHILRIKKALQSDFATKGKGPGNQVNDDNNSQCGDKATGPFAEAWEKKEELIKSTSPFSFYKSYKVRSLMIKGGDDLRQEQLMMQCIYFVKDIVWVRPYNIIVTSADSGILEFCNDTMSLDALKRCMPNMTLTSIFQQIFSTQFVDAQKNFVDSLAGYSLLQWFFQIKDRHNGNILIDNMGHIIHIDFGFILTLSPGGLNFESSPFKLTKEYIEVMDGMDSEMFTYFRTKMYMGFLGIRKIYPRFELLLNLMRLENELPCFDKFDLKAFHDRFRFDLDETQIQGFVNKLIDQSAENKRTVHYDSFQRFTNGILP